MDVVEPSTVDSTKQPFGVLTKTVVGSPTVRWLLHARIRSKNQNDVVFVGDDYIHVKQVADEGCLQHVATKADFDAQIRAAKVLTIDNENPNELLFQTTQTTDIKEAINEIPLELLVLTLSSNDLVFVYLITSDGEPPRFVQQTRPMPKFDRTMFQPTEHLAIDPRSRALAAAADVGELTIYSAKSRENIKQELGTRSHDWCPIYTERPIQVEGAIQLMDFLVPFADDDDHIILLVIVLDQQKIKAIMIDWYYFSNIQEAQIHAGQPLSIADSVPDLLIPLRESAFLLAAGSEITSWRDLASGSVKGMTIQSPKDESAYPGNCPRKPRWTSWCRPTRSEAAKRGKDSVYLVREDGLVYLMEAASSTIIYMFSAGDLKCHAGMAFTSLGDDLAPDLLAVAADMSSGRIVSIGRWPASIGNDMDWKTTMEMNLVETIPNWASVTDFITSALPQSHGRMPRSREGLFVTSGRQPYGAVAELRKGLEAQLLLYLELEGLRGVTGVWVLPAISAESVMILLTNPSSTWLLDCTIDSGMVDEVNIITASALDTEHRTLACAVTHDGHIVQVTEKSICVTADITGNVVDAMKISCDESDCILAASIDTSRSIVVIAQRIGDELALQCFRIPTASMDGDPSAAMDIDMIRGGRIPLACEPLEFTTLRRNEGLFAIIASSDATIKCISIDTLLNIQYMGEMSIPGSKDTQTLCDNVIIISASVEKKWLAVCGLRDGRIYTFVLEAKNDSLAPLNGGHVFSFGESTVKLIQCSRRTAYAMSGIDTCLLSWDGENAASLSIQNILVSDKHRPELMQGPITACASMPLLGFPASSDTAGNTVMVSGDELLIASLSTTPAIVPRQVPVHGTPNRLIYAKQQRCLVCASLRVEVTLSRPEERRQIFPIIDFIPSRGNAPSFTHKMQPGERVYALLEWSFRLAAEDKKYSYILVGGSYTKPSGSTRGRVTLLQPINKNWEITDVKEGTTKSFEDPVFALALYDEMTYVVCTGQYVMLYQFVLTDRRWERVCEPFKLASRGVFVTVARPLVYISTAEDSLVTLRLEESEGKARLEAASMSPRAAQGLSHMVVQPEGLGQPAVASLAFMSAKRGELAGLSCPLPGQVSDRPSKAAEILFEVQLSKSLTRVRQGTIHPRWKPAPPPGVIVDNILGTATDGALVGIALLDETLWRRLSWVQRLCEWSAELSPHSTHAWQTPIYSAAGSNGFTGEERGFPVGLAGGAHEIVLGTCTSRLADRHIDGDVLARVLRNGGADALKRVIYEAAGKQDRAGAWLRDHLQEELEVVDEMVNILRRVLDYWL